MLGILADNHYLAFSFYDFAFFANLFNGWFNLHLLYHAFLPLFRPPGNAPFVEVIHRYLDGNTVARQNFNVVHTQFPRNVSGNYMLIRKFNFEGRVRQCFNYRTLKFYNVVFRQNNPSFCL